jgi:hypothetical protein
MYQAIPHFMTFLRYSVVVLLFIAGCGGGSAVTDSDPLPESQWTLMVFMAGDSDLSQSAFRNINEMEEIGSTSDVQVVVQVEFSPEFSSSLPKNTLRGRIVKDTDNTQIKSTLNDLGNLDMTDPATLTDFIEWVTTQYPARHYAIILWSHGLGWKGPSKGMIKDVTSAGDNYIMSLPNLAQAVHDSGVRLDIIDFDACLMGMYEVAYELKGFSDYITFSEALFPIYGNPYTAILSELISRPDINGEELAHIITSACKDYYKELGFSLTKSAIKSSELEKVHIGVNDLANILINNMAIEGEHIRTAVGNTQEYYSYIYRDLGDFLDQLKMQTTNEQILSSITALDSILNNLVIDNQSYCPDTDNPVARSHGMAIYLPAPGLNISRDLLKYSTLSCNQGDSVTWVDFVTVLSDH